MADGARRPRVLHMGKIEKYDKIKRECNLIFYLNKLFEIIKKIIINLTFLSLTHKNDSFR